MSLLTQAYILETYGPRLDSKQIAEVLGITVPALHKGEDLEGNPSLCSSFVAHRKRMLYTHPVFRLREKEKR